VMIDKDGEVISISEGDFKNAKKNPYAEKLHQAGTVVLDTEVIDFFKQLAKKKGIYHGKLISETLREYMDNSAQIQRQ